MASTINATTSSGIVATADNTGSLALQTSGTTAVTIDTSQNVGIGSTSITREFANYNQLNINGVNGSTIQLQNGGTQRANIVADVNNLYIGATNVSYGMVFGVGGGSGTGTERMRIDSSGKVFIGTTSITVGYSLPGLIIGGSTAPLLKWQSTNGPKSWDAFIDSSGTNLYWAYNGTDKAYINASTGSWTTTSDLRAKKDITDITYGLNAVMELRPVSYLMNEDEDTSKKHLGFIAQEVKTVIDEAVDDVEEGKMYGFDKSGLVPVLVKAIQEQQTIINDLKARIETLEAK